MPDPGLSQAQFDRVWQRLLFLFGMRELYYRQFLRLTDRKIRLVEKGNVNGFTSNWDFTDFDVTSMEDSHLYVRIADETPGTAQAQVSLYTATGASGLVAQGNAADGATATLSEQNSSGIAATVDLGTVTASETDDEHKLLVLPSFPQMLRHIFDDEEDYDSGDGSIRDMVEDALETIRSSMVGIIGNVESSINSMVEGYVKNRIDGFDTSARRLTNFETDGSGNITETHTGLIEELRKAMNDNSTPQKVLERVPTAGALSSQSGNRGAATMSTVTLRPYAQAGKVIFVCQSDTAGSEKFQVKFIPDEIQGDNFDRDQIVASQQMQIKGTFASPAIGIEAVTFSRAWTKTGDGSDEEFGAASTFSETGATADNTSEGELYMELTANGGNWDVAIYSDSSKANEVATATDIAAGASFTANPSNNSNLTVVGEVGSNPAGATLITFDVEFFKADSDGGNSPDRLEFSISEPSTEGLIQRVTGQMFGRWYLKEVNSSPEVPDGTMRRGILDSDLVEA